MIQYPIRLVVEEKGKRSVELRRWADYLFGEKPKGSGYWKYEIDYRGRGGLLDKYEIRYDRRAERFEGTVASHARSLAVSASDGEFSLCRSGRTGG